VRGCAVLDSLSALELHYYLNVDIYSLGLDDESSGSDSDSTHHQQTRVGVNDVNDDDDVSDDDDDGEDSTTTSAIASLAEEFESDTSASELITDVTGDIIEIEAAATASAAVTASAATASATASAATTASATASATAASAAAAADEFDVDDEATLPARLRRFNEWFSGSFPSVNKLRAEFHPMFRVVAVATADIAFDELYIQVMRLAVTTVAAATTTAATAVVDDISANVAASTDC
jgi:hypothetical protein